MSSLYRVLANGAILLAQSKIQEYAVSEGVWN